jgi:hypothetical protein
MYENKIITEPKWKSWIFKRQLLCLHQNNVIKLLHQVEAQNPQQAQVGMNKPGGGLILKKE